MYKTIETARESMDLEVRHLSTGETLVVLADRRTVVPFGTQYAAWRALQELLEELGVEVGEEEAKRLFYN